MDLRVIRDELQYAALLEQAKELAIADPLPSSQAAERLAVISVLLESYEQIRFRLETPDPIDAILYRLAELGLKQKDLAELIGSASRASEILSRKRGLTIEMIRLIHERLNIPAELLIAHPREEEVKSNDLDWTKFPIREMKKRGWFGSDLSDGRSGEDLIRSFFARTSAQASPVLLRKTLTGVQNDENRYAVYAWVVRVLLRAREQRKQDVRYLPGSITDEFLRQLAKLSRSSDGPLLAREFLAMKGVTLVIEQHLPKTKLDGAAMLDDGAPVIGLTLRFDRVDYFWFTLMHELIHVQKHLGRQQATFVDEDEMPQDDERENEANIYAAEAFIPRQIWKSSEAFRTRRHDAVVRLADTLMIHPAIVAGRIQRETSNFRILKEFSTGSNIKSIFNVPSLGEKE
jgi:HTH-type transcriptional regulator / antitoxin HigA